MLERLPADRNLVDWWDAYDRVEGLGLKRLSRILLYGFWKLLGKGIDPMDVKAVDIDPTIKAFEPKKNRRATADEEIAMIRQGYSGGK